MPETPIGKRLFVWTQARFPFSASLTESEKTRVFQRTAQGVASPRFWLLFCSAHCFGEAIPTVGLRRHRATHPLTPIRTHPPTYPPAQHRTTTHNTQPFTNAVWGLIFASLGAAAVVMVILEANCVRRNAETPRNTLRTAPLKLKFSRGDSTRVFPEFFHVFSAARLPV